MLAGTVLFWWNCMIAANADNGRLGWWREGRFGLFIHWGLYAIPAGEWKGQEKDKDLWAEWIMQRVRIPAAEYELLAKQFNPVKFNADDWVRIAREAGMKYIVITAKHCDGFAMFRSKASPFNIVDATPFGRDPMKELSEAGARQGIKFGFYYSHSWDWHEADAPGLINDWDFPPLGKRNLDRYFLGKSLPQVEELVTQYKPAILWFDVPDLSRERSQAFLDVIRRHLPDCVVNDRIGNGLGDYATPEQFVPRDKAGADFEVCMTLNEHWGYDRNDHAWKSARSVIRLLADIAGKGGNLLLNVGPTAEGLFPREAIRILGGVGRWMRVNGASIYETSAGPFGRIPWGVCTAAPGRLYLHVFEWPADGRLFVPGLSTRIERAYLLADAGKKPLANSLLGAQDWIVQLPAKAPDPDDSVVVLEIASAPAVNPALVVLPSMKTEKRDNTLYASSAAIRGRHAQYVPLSLERRKFDFIGYWTDAQDWVEWEFRTIQGGACGVAAVVGADPKCEGNRYTLEVGGRKFAGTVASTGGYEKFQTIELGTVTFAQTGTHRLAIKPVSINPGSGLMNVHAVILTAMP